ncbi:MAG: TlpA family protein disulfide reductase [Pseudobacter sp.]|uniref:TlpA family protein disulfide reductase n=1 Tax=Pseudobacter sp. TaxID=2045420 RepID=UPI003F7D9519
MKKIILLLLISSSVMAQQPASNKKYGIQDFMLIEKVEDMEKKYNQLLKEPAENLAPTALNDFRAELALQWLSKGNVERYRFYKATNPKFSYRQALFLSYAVEKLLDESKLYNDVAQISQQLLDENNDIADRKSVIMEVNAAANAKLGNIEVARAVIAKSSGRYLASASEHGYFRDLKSNYLNRYAMVLSAAGEYKIAFDTLSKAFREAESNPYMVATFKDVYEKVKGSDKGFDQYLKSLQEEAYKKCYEKVEKLYVATPQFTLEGKLTGVAENAKPQTSFVANKPVQDVNMLTLDEKNVNLGNYKGKILVIDFWTTGCTPCVAAFAGFEKVVADYRKDEFQMFVVNIFEDKSTVKAFAAQKPIKLEVLRDEENKMYDIRATPTKIIFDPAGHIRFYSSGYAGSTDREYYKLKAMVEITRARASNNATASAK